MALTKNPVSVSVTYRYRSSNPGWAAKHFFVKYEDMGIIASAMYRRIFVIIYCLLFSEYLLAKEWRRDFQIWDEEFIQGKLTDNVDLLVGLAFRWRHEGRQFFYNHQHIELPIHVASNFIVGPAFRLVYRRFSHEECLWVPVYNFQLNLSYFYEKAGWKLSGRTRIVYIKREEIDGHNTWQYRQRVALNSPPFSESMPCSFFLDEEIFLEQRQRGIYQNRITAGLNCQPWKRFLAIIGYRFQSLRESSYWAHNDILLLNFQVSF